MHYVNYGLFVKNGDKAKTDYCELCGRERKEKKKTCITCDTCNA